MIQSQLLLHLFDHPRHLGCLQYRQPKHKLGIIFENLSGINPKKRSNPTLSMLFRMLTATLIEPCNRSAVFVSYLFPIRDFATSVNASTHWVMSLFMVPQERVGLFSAHFFHFFCLALNHPPLKIAFDGVVALKYSMNSD